MCNLVCNNKCRSSEDVHRHASSVKTFLTRVYSAHTVDHWVLKRPQEVRLPASRKLSIRPSLNAGRISSLMCAEKWLCYYFEKRMKTKITYRTVCFLSIPLVQREKNSCTVTVPRTKTRHVGADATGRDEVLQVPQLSATGTSMRKWAHKAC